MPKQIKIKKEFQDAQVGYNNSGLPFRFRNDQHLLAKIAIESGDDSLLNLFEETPTMEDVLEIEGSKFLDTLPPTPPEAAAEAIPEATPEVKTAGSNKSGNVGSEK